MNDFYRSTANPNLSLIPIKFCKFFKMNSGTIILLMDEKKFVSTLSLFSWAFHMNYSFIWLIMQRYSQLCHSTQKKEIAKKN